MKTIVATLVFVLPMTLTATTAWAEKAVPDEDLSPATATALSLAGTVGAWGLLIGGASADSPAIAMVGAAGTLFAPSFGHWYAGKPVTAGFGVRVAGVLSTVVGAGLVLSNSLSVGGEGWHTNVGAPLFFGGVGLYGVGTIYDIATAGRSAREHNAEQSYALAPMVMRDGAGFALAGRF